MPTSVRSAGGEMGGSQVSKKLRERRAIDGAGTDTFCEV